MLACECLGVRNPRVFTPQALCHYYHHRRRRYHSLLLCSLCSPPIAGGFRHAYSGCWAHKTDSLTLALCRYGLIAGDQCRNAQESGFLNPVEMPCEGTSLGEEVGKALGYLIAAGLISTLLLAFVFTFSKDARVAAISLFSTDGKIGSFLLRFNCFQRTEGAYVVLISTAWIDQRCPLVQSRTHRLLVS